MKIGNYNVRISRTEGNKYHFSKKVTSAMSITAVLSFLVVTTVTAADSFSINGTSYSTLVNSKGIVTYDNPSGTDITIDASDIQENRTAIANLNSNVNALVKQTAGLNGNLIYKDGSYYIDTDGDANTTDDQTPIGAVGDATVDMVLKGHTFSSASAGVKALGTMEIPTLLTLGTCTGDSNDGISDNVTIGNAYGQTTDNDEIDLGIGDSITIPAGYYDKPLTINNSVINRGSLNTVLTSTNKNLSLSPGYYNSSSISTDISNLPGTIDYTLVHQHTGSSTSGGGCYTVAHTKTTSSKRACGTFHRVSSGNDSNGVMTYNYKCSTCGAYCGWQPSTNGGSDPEGTTHYVTSTSTSTYYTCGCELNEGDYIRDTDDYSSIAANEKISKVTITY